MGTQLKTIDIKGKQYVEVNQRIKYFRENFKDWSLLSDIVEIKDGRCIIKAIITNETGRVIATGLAYEVEGSSFINKTSYIENCETSAWGRALGNLGIGIDTSVASFEEVANAIKNQSGIKDIQQPKKIEKPIDNSENKTYSLIITNVVDKKSANGSKYFIFETNVGKFRTFSESIAEKMIKAFTNKEKVSVIAVEGKYGFEIKSVE